MIQTQRECAGGSESGRGVWRESSESVWRRFESVQSYNAYLDCTDSNLNKALDHQEAWKQQSWIDTHVPFHALTSLCLEVLCF